MSNTEASTETNTKANQQVEGEGSYSATHRYQKDLKQYQEQGDPERAAQRAKQAVEGEEGKQLQQAEDEAKRRGQQISQK
ncbi:MAG: hypothetical protein KC766_12520 [Myxococcales bacterium]|nr:hypothetical protein [Myxococcales bacterium]